MSISKNILRLITIQRILVGYRLDELLNKVPALRSFKYFFILLPRKISKNSSLGERIRRALEELGPIFVKFGQVVSTRRDLLPEEIADELAKLQDQVTPFSTSRGPISIRKGTPFSSHSLNLNPGDMLSLLST